MFARRTWTRRRHFAGLEEPRFQCLAIQSGSCEYHFEESVVRQFWPRLKAKRPGDCGVSLNKIVLDAILKLTRAEDEAGCGAEVTTSSRRWRKDYSGTSAGAVMRTVSWTKKLDDVNCRAK